MAEHQIVDLAVAGSNPASHPKPLLFELLASGPRGTRHPPAMRSLAISLSRSHAGDEDPVDVAISWTMPGSAAGSFPLVSPPPRLTSHRSERSASASRRGSSAGQSNAASYSR